MRKTHHKIFHALHMRVVILFRLTDGVVDVGAADRIWQILHAAIGHGAVEELFVVGAADLDVDLSQAGWQLQRAVDLNWRSKSSMRCSCISCGRQA